MREEMMLRVFVDYNTISDDERERVAINTVIFKYLLEHLQPNLPIILYDNESLEVNAVAEFDQEDQAWYGIPDWSTRRELPPLTQAELDSVSKLMSR
jgi:ethanolamine ammonia-lyase large subunit